MTEGGTPVFQNVGTRREVLLPIVSSEIYLPQANEDILDYG